MSASSPIERVSTDDLMALASDRGSTPMQVGAVLVLDTRGGFDPVAVVEAIAGRLPAVPRLRQRLVAVPWWLGRPIWVDDPGFAVTDHVSTVRCPAPGGEAAILRLAERMLLSRLPRSHPLWAATVVTDMGPGQAALIVVFHHVLADGIGGLAVPKSLADGADGADGADRTDGADEVRESVFPRKRPAPMRLAVESGRDHLRSVGRLPAALRRLRGGVTELRPTARVRPVRSSLNKPTGPRRRIATVRVPLEAIRATAHTHHATVNDVLLSAIAGALHRLLATRGESVDQFVLSVPFSARRQAGSRELGNQSGAIPIAVPALRDPVRRLAAVSELTRLAKRSPPGASSALLGPLFRLLSRAGLFRWFVDHQRFIHTFVSNLRGPETRISMLGCPITGIIPLSVATGNVTVAFAALSYGDWLTLTLTADPDACRDLVELRELLDREFGDLVGTGP